MFRLAHISDVHLGPLPPLSVRDLASKRITGYVNWRRNRARAITGGALDAMLADLARHATDHIAVTGDLVNLALDAEIETARQWLEALGDPQTVSVVPGNHDAYVPGAFNKACRAWAPWMTGEEHGASGRWHFPYMRQRGPVALIGLTSAEATAPFMATGFFRGKQRRAATALLENARAEGLFRVILIHHPPVRGAAEMHKRLNGIGRFEKMMRETGADLVLHGHTHLNSLHMLDGATGPVPVVGVAAGGQGVGGRRPASTWNLIEISGKPRRWSVTLTRRSMTGATGLFETFERVPLYSTGDKMAVPA